MNERIRVGDRVRIANAWFVHNRQYNGHVGVVRKIRANLPGVYPWRYWVEVSDGTLVDTVNVSLDARALEDKPEPEVLIDAKRLQAAQAAHEMLGKDAFLDDLIGVAEFVLGEHKDAAKRTAISTVFVDVKATTSAAVPTDEALKITDEDDDWVKTEYLAGEPPHIAHITASDEGAYLTADGVDSLIARLQQFKAKAAQA